MAHRERSLDEADKLSSDVGFDIFVIWWVEPYNISLSLALLCWWSLWWSLELQSVCVTAFSERFFVRGRCFIEDVFIRRNARALQICFQGFLVGGSIGCECTEGCSMVSHMV